VEKANTTGWLDAYVGDYVVITTGPGIGEGLVIEAVYNDVTGDADTLEVTGTFSADITSSSDLTVVPASTYTRWAFNDMYAYYGVLLLLDDVVANSDGWERLLDQYGSLNTISSSSGTSPPQDRTYLSTVLLAGQRVFDYLVETN
jgi:hypothetical protein